MALAAHMIEAIMLLKARKIKSYSGMKINEFSLLRFLATDHFP